MSLISPITSHVLDTALGRPARGLRVRLDVLYDDGAWKTISERVTNDDGRIADFLPKGRVEPRTYRLTFDTEAYFESTERPVFYPQVDVVFVVDTSTDHYHVPLLLSPFGYSTYRGS